MIETISAAPSPYQCTEASFLKDVASHRINVLRDDGLYRHVRFMNPNNSNMFFDLVTWPGYLAYIGDMGSFVFKRHPDMFTFFRTDEARQLKDGLTLAVSHEYWAEKCQASERGEGIERFSSEKFRQCVTEWLDDREASAELREAVADEVLSSDESEDIAMRAALDFTHNGEDIFTDFWEVNLKEYTQRYVWCCYAIPWGIQQYDAWHAQQNQSLATGHA